MSNPKKPRSSCLNCGNEPARAGYKYCSNSCQFTYQYESTISAWKEGKISGLKNIGIVTAAVKKYLRHKFNNKCCLCGWAEVNPITKKVPLVADHIDGNWRNNTEKNLRLICPNCDSLTPTFANLNKGNGRNNRSISKRAREARLVASGK